MRFSTSFATLAFVTFASAAPSNAVRQVPGDIYPCTDSTFPAGSPCPYGISRGSGFCAALSVEPGVCYNWASFPAEDVAPLISNLTFIEIPVVQGGIYGCDVYLEDDCTGESGTIQLGQNDFSCPGLGPQQFNDKVASFKCYLG
ncbi:hypothetical protein IFR04_015926 [Cadophora malorum]|uniref:Uncharacterized protein n=1 Tax=Cadophora malorum TaxID=108018 RepID=A0A8H7SY19_9HELO|nr:hypothetical protein IFR04_015926 [Cadophora malorum]